MLGVIATDKAKRIARDQGLDLVEVSPTAQPPVCRIMDYGKFQYNQNRKQKQNKKAGSAGAVKEVKFRASTEDHDYNTKLNKIKGFLEKGHKVKVTLFFRGRENAHRELGFDQINRVLKDCEELANVEMQPKMVGQSVGLHPVWLMFALSAFGVMMGFTGLLIAVPVAAAIGVLVRYALKKYLASSLYLGEGNGEEAAQEQGK